MKSTNEETLRLQCLQMARESEPMADADRLLEIARQFYAFVKQEQDETDTNPKAAPSPKKGNQ